MGFFLFSQTSSSFKSPLRNDNEYHMNGEIPHSYIPDTKKTPTGPASNLTKSIHRQRKSDDKDDTVNPVSGSFFFEITQGRNGKKDWRNEITQGRNGKKDWRNEITQGRNEKKVWIFPSITRRDGGRLIRIKGNGMIGVIIC